MQTDKPLISILMAVYEPNLKWFREQLQSLELQTYPNLRLYVQDDCSLTVPFSEIEGCVKDCIHTIPYKIGRNEKNIGSNRTFERLTTEAEGMYFAYCDQDDIWMPDKLSILETNLEKQQVSLVCFDVEVMDRDGNRTADSIRQVRRRHRFLSGKEEVFHHLLTRNFAIGCTMLVRRETALSAIPFLPEMVHDHWIALVASSCDGVLSLKDRLIRYRIHGGNQTGVLTDVSCKREYIDLRIIGFEKRLRHICERFPDIPATGRTLQWAKARMEYALRGKYRAAVRLWKLRSENRPTTLFELFALKLPEPLFRKALHIAKKSG